MGEVVFNVFEYFGVFSGQQPHEVFHDIDVALDGLAWKLGKHVKAVIGYGLLGFEYDLFVGTDLGVANPVADEEFVVVEKVLMDMRELVLLFELQLAVIYADVARRVIEFKVGEFELFFAVLVVVLFEFVVGGGVVLFEPLPEGGDAERAFDKGLPLLVAFGGRVIESALTGVVPDGHVAIFVEADDADFQPRFVLLKSGDVKSVKNILNERVFGFCSLLRGFLLGGCFFDRNFLEFAVFAM